MRRRRILCAISGGTPVERPLPDGYTPYSWIKCATWNDGSYIDTGIANQATGITVKMKIKNTVSNPNGNQFFGTKTGWLHTLDLVTSDTFRWVTKVDEYYYLTLPQYIGAEYEVSAGDEFLNINGNNGIAHSDRNNYVGGNLILLAGTSHNTEIPIYYCQIYRDGILVRDYVPCSDPLGEPGVFDFVSNTFFGNAGTGSLIVGQDS